MIVIKAEEDKLKAAGKSNLLVKHIAAEDDGAGYDILSYDEYGKEMKIEVKSTKAKIGDANFYLSDNELTKAKQVDNYWIYIVYEADTSNPKIWKIKNPFLQKDIVKIVPTQYKVAINVKQEGLDNVEKSS
ncbi:DUF3883 domain-containing protein [Anaerovorax sp. IOR16]|uniref:DUF3883 domain-containing protein n=1 Tax=Anaerovorax sp. IOR16 TaxID=2773458 RepID=UPI0019D2226C|nr:DUF3883 domain-containing protein [Anaerovorax sp. IOR16]